MPVCLGLAIFCPRIRSTLRQTAFFQKTSAQNPVWSTPPIPAQATPTLYTWKNVQMESNWSGIEYSFASFLLENGSYEEAARIVETVERRHTQNGDALTMRNAASTTIVRWHPGQCYSL